MSQKAELLNRVLGVLSAKSQTHVLTTDGRGAALITVFYDRFRLTAEVKLTSVIAVEGDKPLKHRYARGTARDADR